jgi:MscS family membrane protein
LFRLPGGRPRSYFSAGQCRGILLAGILRAQPSIPETKDPLGRSTPQEAVFQFLETCHARNYSKALYYLDLRRMPAAARTKDGPELARQLEDLLDDTPFEITTLSRDPEGDQADGLSPAFERLDTFHVDKETLELQLERVELRLGFKVWLVSADSVAMIPKAHQAVAETPFEKKLPQQLVTFEILDTPVWRWIALLVMALAVWMVAGFLSWAMVAAVRPLVDAPGFRGPVRVGLAVAGFRAALEIASPATLSRTFIERALGLIFFLAVAWAGAVVVDLIAERLALTS